MNAVFGWLQLNCFMNSLGLIRSTHATRDPCDPVESLTSLSGTGRRKIEETSKGTFKQSTFHCFTLVLRDLCSQDIGKFSFHLIQPLSSPSYKASGESSTSFKDGYIPRGWNNLYLLHSYSSRNIAVQQLCITDAAVQGVR